jgi:hypothetical protein
MKKRPVVVCTKWTFGNSGAVTLTDNGEASTSVSQVATGLYWFNLDSTYADFLGYSAKFTQNTSAPNLPGTDNAHVIADYSKYPGTGIVTLASVVATNTLSVAGVTFTAIAGATSGQSFHVGANDTATAVELAAAINNASSQAAFAALLGQTVVVNAVAYSTYVILYASDRYIVTTSGATLTLLPNAAPGQLGYGGQLIATLSSGSLASPNSGDKLLLDSVFNDSTVK